MAPVARMMIFAGLAVTLVGLIVLGLSKVVGPGRMPLDLRWERPGLTVWAPIGTMIVVSLILTLVVNLLLWMRR